MFPSFGGSKPLGVPQQTNAQCPRLCPRISTSRHKHFFGNGADLIQLSRDWLCAAMTPCTGPSATMYRYSKCCVLLSPSLPQKPTPCGNGANQCACTDT